MQMVYMWQQRNRGGEEDVFCGQCDSKVSRCDQRAAPRRTGIVALRRSTAGRLLIIMES